jgi:hypothetical protein
VVVAAVALLALNRGGDRRPPAGTADPGRASQSPAAAGPAATVTGRLVADPRGADEIRGVVALASGDLVAVGQSADQHPRAWLRAGTAWRAVALPGTGTAGAADVAVSGTRVVAVGWAREGAQGPRRAAVWTSTSGGSWTRAALPADLQAAGVGELTAVVAVPDGGFLAAAIDRRVDRDGDVALFRSADGGQWRRASADGISGPGAQQVQRIAADGSGGYVAVGAALAGARLGPAVWTSTDGQHWQPDPIRPDGSPTLWSVLPRPGGGLLACGAVGTVDRPAAGCWLRRGAVWTPVEVTGSPVPLAIYALAAAGGSVLAVGSGRDGTTVDAAAWQLSLPDG